MKKLKRCMFFLVIILFTASFVLSANLGIPCDEIYSGCDANYCTCANICGEDYECGAEDGINPEIFFNGKTCPPGQQDPDACGIGETLVNGECISVVGTCDNDGIAEIGESCDGSDLRGVGCGDFGGFSSGTLLCGNNCEYDFSQCDGYACDNDESADIGEACDGSDLRDMTCSNFDEFIDGNLLCTDECMFSTSSCSFVDLIGVCDYDEICEPAEGCGCDDCLNEQDSCISNAVCSYNPETEFSSCQCTEETTYCVSLNMCVESLDQCPDFNSETDCPSNCDKDASAEDKLLFSCLCDICDGQQDSCTYIASCYKGLCKNCELDNVQWEKTCTENNYPVNLTVDGDDLCNDKQIELLIKQKDDDLIESGSADFNNGQAVFEWTAEWYDVDTFFQDNPEYYVVAELAKVLSEESSQDILLEVQPCNNDYDSDCDEICDPGFVCEDNECCNGEQCCNNENGDACPNTPECMDVDEFGCTEGQSSCLVEWDCTPEWWGMSIPDEWSGIITSDEANNALEWSECVDRADPERLVKERQICPDPDGNCCTGQSNCYCKIPEDPQCIGVIRPVTEKSCLTEEKFPVFTLSNIIITIILLTVYFIVMEKRGKWKK